MFEYLLYKIGSILAVVLPIRFSYRVAEFIADIKYIVSRRERFWMRENLRMVMPVATRKGLRRCSRQIFRNFAKYLVDFFRFEILNPEYIKSHIEIEGLEYIDSALEEGKGAIILSAHLGNWEIGGAALALMGYPMNCVALDHKNALVNNFFIHQRQINKEKVISIRFTLRRCFNCLEDNELLAILGDKDFTNTGIPITFFSKIALIPKGPALFSIKTGAVIIPGYTVRMKDDYFQMVFTRPIRPNPTGDLQRDLAELTSLCIERLQEFIKRYPSQWYCFRQIFMD